MDVAHPTSISMLLSELRSLLGTVSPRLSWWGVLWEKLAEVRTWPISCSSLECPGRRRHLNCTAYAHWWPLTPFKVNFSAEEPLVWYIRFLDNGKMAFWGKNKCLWLECQQNLHRLKTTNTKEILPFPAAPTEYKEGSSKSDQWSDCLSVWWGQ